MLTDFRQLDLSKRYTYADYLTWQFDEMVELIKGRVLNRPGGDLSGFWSGFESGV